MRKMGATLATLLVAVLSMTACQVNRNNDETATSTTTNNSAGQLRWDPCLLSPELLTEEGVDPTTWTPTSRPKWRICGWYTRTSTLRKGDPAFSIGVYVTTHSYEEMAKNRTETNQRPTRLPSGTPARLSDAVGNPHNVTVTWPTDPSRGFRRVRLTGRWILWQERSGIRRS
ncbi:hypothetical protein [Gordonia araii]|uniref:hypothetical protein n=1 Tax=Gordonia araii TaxID=263909 RepID=UPI001478752B|nr:hypothetical protein [Gordonia araii]NNG95640.1 hypothetical protein [Gordonia araii NBRC 100433]